MNIKPNIGLLNALIRITIGLTMLSWCTAKLVKHPWRDSYLFVALCGAMKVAEGIVRYCPITALYERCQEMMPEKSAVVDSMDGMEGLTNLDGDQGVPYNPT
ncbi:DUF2892 domain-containing protein [Neobacillus sp. NPDC093127]|uniref:YgaP family membrane protein n=1 Tax=Neobacillus sp. NPDC093127 TaxID=3364296 RepID=UPI003827F317